MRELIDILAAHESLDREGKPAALATVVAVSGSSYRRPGARMLIAEDARTWGGVSGGCLERDVILRARGVIASCRAMITRYDTADDEQLASGVATGCGGTVDVFLQPITLELPGPMRLLRAAMADRSAVTFATLIRAKGVDRDRCGSVTMDDGLSGLGIVRRDEWDYFVDTIRPPQRLVIFGAGPDVVPVVQIAKTLGWHVTVVGSHPATHLSERFCTADVLRVTSTLDPLAGLMLRADDAVLVMTHNVARDGAILAAIPTRPRYLGVLGPRHRSQRLIEMLSTDIAAAVVSPIGLDLGAETPQEIALAVVAEIQAVLRHRTSLPLSEKPGPIHDRSVVEPFTPRRAMACPL